MVPSTNNKILSNFENTLRDSKIHKNVSINNKIIIINTQDFEIQILIVGRFLLSREEYVRIEFIHSLSKD
jgi:hypothetical protein